MNNQKRDWERINIPPDIVTKAEEGYATAQLELGKVYYKASSVENNATTAFEWIYRSAEQGNMEAQFRLGDLYALGFGTVKSLPDSYKWYTKSAIQGYKKALIRIHNLYQQDIEMYCRGQLNDKEKKWTSDDFKRRNNIRELYEYRLKLNKNILNGAVEYYTNQFKYYQSSDQKVDVVQLNLAFLYQHGYGTNKCSRWAFEYYSLAAEQGNIDAQYNIGHLYHQHTRKKFNYREAFKWYTKSAEGGSISAQRCLAYFYLKGLATDINYEVALSWYTKAADTGDSQAQVTLGMLYRKGEYVKGDLSVAVKWYTLAARQGSIVAKNCLSKLHTRGMLIDIEVEEDTLEYLTEDLKNSILCSKLSVDISKLGASQGFKKLDKLAKNALIGDGPAMYQIGLRYYHGNIGFPEDKDIGIKWIKNAADRQHKDAQFMMTKLYKDGDSIDQDYHKSCIWFKAIAKQKDAYAQFQVGFMYYKGLGVRYDPLEASKWFTWAANQENSDARFSLGLLRIHGDGIRQDKDEAKDWFYKSVLQKNFQACSIVGEMVYNGEIKFKENEKNKESEERGLRLLEFAARNKQVEAQLFLGNIYVKKYARHKHTSKSIGFYTMAANSGNNEAQYKLAIAYLNGDGVECNYIKAYRLFKLAKDRNYRKAKRLFQTPPEIYEDLYNCSEVINMFTEVTANGIDDLTFNIGAIYEHGIKKSGGYNKVVKNYKKAEKWYLVASDKGDSRAYYRLGVMYEKGKGVEQNMVTSINYYKQAVEKENVDAINRLAAIYLKGYGITQSYLEAFCLYTRASNMGHKGATEVMMAFKYENTYEFDYAYNDYDETTAVNREQIVDMFENTTRQGISQLQYQLGLMHERKAGYLKAFEWFTLASNIGITDAYYRLGVVYEEGTVVKQNYTMAADMYQKATEKEHEEACYRLGQLYLNGNGVKQNYLEAYIFYKKAADMGHDMASKFLNITQEINIKANGDTEKNYFNVQSKSYKKSFTMCKYVAEHGDPEVQFKVGFAYQYCSPKPDYKEAFKWYATAAKRSHKEAMYHVGLLYENGLGISQNYYKAIQLYKRAVQFGSGDALHRLGILYHHGKGVDIDPVKAIEYYTLSAKGGNSKYQCELGRLYEKGELAQKNPLEALKWYTKAYLQGYDSIGSKLYDLYEDKPYENFFFERLLRNLSIASYNYFSLNDKYNYKHFGDINNRLGFMCFFGVGTSKNLKQSLQYFLKEYSDKKKEGAVFCFFGYGGFSFNEKVKILEEFENDEECMGQLSPEEQYILGMVFYEGKVEVSGNIRYFNYDDEKKKYISVKKGDLRDPIQHTAIKKNYSKAFNYLKRAANKSHPKALLQLGIMYHCGHGVQKNSDEGDVYFDLAARSNVDLIGEITILYHTHDDIQNFSKAHVYYGRLEKRLTYISSLDGDDQHKINELIQIGSGLLYEYGDGVGQDYQKTNELIQIGSGLLYEYGDGVEQDYQKAISYYKELADNNNKMGTLRLGLMYYYGKGVPVDYKKAKDLFETYGSSSLDLIPYVYEEENNLQTSDDVDDSKRNRVYCTLTYKGIQGERKYYLGLMYKQGQGVTKDEEEAREYFRGAFDCGCKRAENEIQSDLDIEIDRWRLEQIFRRRNLGNFFPKNFDANIM